MKLKPYPTYKDSGVEWLEKIPQHWSINYYRRHIYIEQGKAFSSADYVEESSVACFRMGNIKKGGLVDLEHNIKFLPDSFLNLHQDMLVQKNDMLISMTDMSPSLDFLAIPAIFIQNDTNFKFLLNQRVGRVKSFNICQNFLRYALLSEELRLQLKQKGLGTVQSNMSNDDLYSSRLAVPDINEQEKIASFLDRETSKLDTLISKQEHLIELLQEKRQGIISHAVTKGLNPDAKMKDSGVEWMGMVPDHWKVRRLKFNLCLLNEKTDSRDFSIGLENIEGWSGNFLKTDTEFEGEGIAFKEGDILFGKLRPYLAKVYLAEFSGEAVGDFHVMRPREGIFGRFAQYQMLNREFISIVDGSTYGAKMPRASWDFVGGMLITTPPKSEQESIATYLDNQTAKIDTLIVKAKRSIDLAKEHRTALISAAVTGKIDVREAA